MRSVYNVMKSGALGVAENLTPILKVRLVRVLIIKYDLVSASLSWSHGSLNVCELL